MVGQFPAETLHLQLKRLSFFMDILHSAPRPIIVGVNRVYYGTCALFAPQAVQGASFFGFLLTCVACQTSSRYSVDISWMFHGLP